MSDPVSSPIDDEADETPKAPPHRFAVERGEAGMRLQSFIAARLEISGRAAGDLLDRGLVMLAGHEAKYHEKGLKVTEGQIVTVARFDPPQLLPVLANPALEVPVIAADSPRGWLVVNKPAGMPVHPLIAEETQTVSNALIARCPQMQGVGEGGLRSGVLHRLDVETSGALAFATAQGAWQRLRDAFREHRTLKIYHAIVLGQPAPHGQVRLPLRITQHKPAKVRVVEEDKADHPAVRWCDLAWRVAEQFPGTPGAALLEISLGTGFLHQIRATFAHLKFPIAGDVHYLPNWVADHTDARRVMLHARRLVAEEIDVEAEYPRDFVEMLEKLRGG